MYLMSGVQSRLIWFYGFFFFPTAVLVRCAARVFFFPILLPYILEPRCTRVFPLTALMLQKLAQLVRHGLSSGKFSRSRFVPGLEVIGEAS